MPYNTAIGTTYDSGDFAAVLDKALALADYDGFKRRRREAGKRGKYRGHRHFLHARACRRRADRRRGDRRFRGDGSADPSTSTSNRPARDMPRCFRAWSPNGWAFRVDKIHHRHGDSALEIPGFASVASRSAMTAGSADRSRRSTPCWRRASASRRRCWKRRRATSPTRRAHSRWSAPTGASRCSISRGAPPRCKRAAKFEEASTPRPRSETPAHLSQRRAISRRSRSIRRPASHGIVAYAAVDDCGNVLDPMIVEGQLHGALAQGLGQAADGAGVLRPDSGQLITGSFMDYAMPRAADMPPASATRSISCRRPPIRSASRAWAKPAPRPPSRRS